MTPRPDTDATRGVCARPLAKRAVSLVDTRTRRHDPFASRASVTQTLSKMRSRDDGASPSDAIAIACQQDELLVLPRPRSGRECVTVKDARRVAACMRRYQAAGETGHAETCVALLDSGLPRVLTREYVTGP